MKINDVIRGKASNDVVTITPDPPCATCSPCSPSTTSAPWS